MTARLTVPGKCCGTCANLGPIGDRTWIGAGPGACAEGWWSPMEAGKFHKMYPADVARVWCDECCPEAVDYTPEEPP